MSTWPLSLQAYNLGPNRLKRAALAPLPTNLPKRHKITVETGPRPNEGFWVADLPFRDVSAMFVTTIEIALPYMYRCGKICCY
jgi:hypothetical protein